MRRGFAVVAAAGLGLGAVGLGGSLLWAAAMEETIDLPVKVTGTSIRHTPRYFSATLCGEHLDVAAARYSFRFTACAGPPLFGGPPIEERIRAGRRLILTVRKAEFERLSTTNYKAPQKSAAETVCVGDSELTPSDVMQRPTKLVVKDGRIAGELPDCWTVTRYEHEPPAQRAQKALTDFRRLRILNDRPPGEEPAGLQRPDELIAGALILGLGMLMLASIRPSTRSRKATGTDRPAPAPSRRRRR
jgi:hypothetical protein